MYLTSSKLKYLLLLSPLCLFSCLAPQELTYFQTPEGKEWQKQMAITNSIDLTIQEGDELIIIVSSFDPIAVGPFNLQAQQSGQSQQASLGYQVGKDGSINFPVLGKIQVIGLSLNNLHDTLAVQIKEYVNDPVINIRYANFRVTVIGEVNAPGFVTTNVERLSIIEAIGQAGDITNFGDRSNILLIREQDGERIMERLDLLCMDIFTSPYYYLKQNDIIYIEPTEAKSTLVSAQRTSRILSLVTSITSFAALIVALAK